MINEYDLTQQKWEICGKMSDSVGYLKCMPTKGEKKRKEKTESKEMEAVTVLVLELRTKL